VFYVAPYGNDGNSGTEGAPFRSIQQAVNSATAGATVLVKAGTYAERVVIDGKSGQAEAFFTVQRFGTDRVVIDGAGSLANAFLITNSNHVVIRGFEVTRIGDTANYSGAVRVENSANVFLDANTISDFNYNGIRLKNNRNITIQRNTILRTKDAPTAGDAHLLSIWHDGVTAQGGYVIRHNTIRDLTGIPRGAKYWDCIGGGSNFRLDGFVARDSDIHDNFVEGCNDDGIEAEGAMVNVRIWGNRIKDTYSGISSAPTIVGPLYVFRNLVIGSENAAVKLDENSDGHRYLYHNTIYTERAADAIQQSGRGLWNVHSRNNIIHAGRYVIEFTTSGAGATHSFDYDSMFTSDAAGRFVKWDGNSACCTTLERFRSATGQEVHGLSADARTELVAPGAGNFALKSSSRLVDRGIVLAGFNDGDSAWPYAGQAPDIGALEYGAGLPAAPTATVVPTRTATAVPTLTATTIPTLTATAVPTRTSTPVPSSTPLPSATRTPTPLPTSTPASPVSPSATVAISPTTMPAASPTKTSVLPAQTATAPSTATKAPATATVAATSTRTATPAATSTPADTDGPSGWLVKYDRDSSGRAYYEIGFGDTGSGLGSIAVSCSTNAAVSVPTLTRGTLEPAVVRFTQITDGTQAVAMFVVRDVAGNTGYLTASLGGSFSYPRC
jgi:parallel beta-helix repeat protein